MHNDNNKWYNIVIFVAVFFVKKAYNRKVMPYPEITWFDEAVIVKGFDSIRLALVWLAWNPKSTQVNAKANLPKHTFIIYAWQTEEEKMK